MQWQALVMDEIHVLKNKDTDRFHSVQDIMARKRIGLSGIPAQNNLQEYFAPLHTSMYTLRQRRAPRESVQHHPKAIGC